MFCLFADDTGIFEPRDILFDLLESRTSEAGADFGLWLSQLFEVLKELYAGPMLETLADRMSVINVDQFHGIEIGEFPVRIAETALVDDGPHHEQPAQSGVRPDLARYPRRYNVEVLPTEPFLVVPEVSSERREYVPIGWLEPPTIPSNKVRIAEGATKPLFAFLTSAMHMAWLRQIGGRLKSDYSYGIGIVYNTFPPPPVEQEALERLTQLVDAVLSARAAHPGATLAELYDPDLMPVDLRRAHQAIDRLYRRRRFHTESERLEHLLGLYEQMQAPIAVEAARVSEWRRESLLRSSSVACRRRTTGPTR